MRLFAFMNDHADCIVIESEAIPPPGLIELGLALRPINILFVTAAYHARLELALGRKSGFSLEDFLFLEGVPVFHHGHMKNNSNDFNKF